MSDRPVSAIDEAAEAILIAHQRRDFGSCLCGWADLGRSHPGHQVAALREAGLLAERDPRVRAAQKQPKPPPADQSWIKMDDARR